MIESNNQPGQSVLDVLFEQNAWANLKLLDYCERLSEEQLDATAVGTYGSIRDTLAHIVRAEVGYVRRVNGKLPAEALPREQFPGFPALKAAARWASLELLELALSAQAETLVREEWPEQQMVEQYHLASLMMQSLTHSTEHRTHVAAIITQLGLEPPDMSGWNYMVETGDYQEIKETKS